MNENIFKFEKDSRAKEIPLEILRDSVAIETARGGFPRNRPVESWEFIEELQESLDKAGIVYTMDPIYVDPTHSKRMLTRKEKEVMTPDTTPAEKWLFESVVGKVSFPNNDNPDFNGGLAYSFNKRGLNVAWGTYVQSCSNMSIWGDNLACTYKNGSFEAMKYQALRDKLENWMANFDQKFAIDKQIVQLLMDTEVKFTSTTFVGALYVRAMKQSYHNGQAPFDTHAVSHITQKMLNDKTKVQDMSGWELFNLGTNFLQPTSLGTTDVWENTQLWSDVIFSLLGIMNQIKEIQAG